MPDRPQPNRSDRFGLAMVAASLIVIAIITGLLFKHQQETRENHIRIQGLELARLLSELPGSLLHDNRIRSVLDVLRQHQRRNDFAYAVVVDTQGKPLAETRAPGVIVPSADLPADPHDWFGVRTIDRGGAQRPVFDFHSPVLEAGDLTGYVRLGYTKPGWGFESRQVAFLATLALPIFLLTPLFYFLLRREIRPLRQVSGQIQSLMEQQDPTEVKIHASGELADFIQRFNHFVASAQNRIRLLEGEQTKLQTSTKLLSYRRARVESVLQTIPDAVLVLDELGVINFSNAKVPTLLGLPAEDVVGQNVGEWCRNHDLLFCINRLTQTNSTRLGTEPVPFSPVHAPDKTLAVSSYPLFSPSESGEVYGTLVVFRDITAEAMAKRGRGEFVAHVAHELKTPLNVLAMYSEALQNDEDDNESFRIEAVNVIGDEVERLSMLINNLLNITKIEMGSLKLERNRVKLRDLLQDAFETVNRSGHNQKLHFELNLPRELTPISVDKDLLRVAINNLLTNAIKYTDPGGRISLSAEETDEVIRIQVTDTGIGIPPEDRHRIFEKFFRSNNTAARQRTGHGLGLSLALEIVQLHHGNLTVDSVLGEGTTFTLEFRKELGILEQAI